MADIESLRRHPNHDCLITRKKKKKKKVVARRRRIGDENYQKVCHLPFLIARDFLWQGLVNLPRSIAGASL